MYSKLDDLRNEIKEHVDFVDLKPYSSNIISLCLRQISNGYGYMAANKAIKDYGLARLGWSPQKSQ